MVAATQPRRFPNSFLGLIPAPRPLLSNSLRSSCLIPLLSSSWIASVSLSKSTLVGSLASVENKGLTESLNPLDATLTKNRGGGVVIVNQVPVHQDRSRESPAPSGLLVKGLPCPLLPSEFRTSVWRVQPNVPLVFLGDAAPPCYIGDGVLPQERLLLSSFRVTSSARAQSR